MKDFNGKEMLNVFNIALKIAEKAHEGQLDKAGEPYINHPIRVSNSFKPTQVVERTVALLHDVLEDSDITVQDLRQAGIPNFIIECVECLTRKSNESYPQFIMRCSKHEITTAVKLADLEDNLDVKRLRELGQNDLIRINKYLEARRFLIGEK